MNERFFDRTLKRALFGLGLAATVAALPYSACAVRHASVATVPNVTRAAAVEQPEPLSNAQFASLLKSLSEDGGYFHSDNFTSNETSYLHVIGKLEELGVAGGAYLGVGPEQNFTYIAHVRPRIAFIVDIRRQAMLQHLLYKAIFQFSDNRAAFLSQLTSRPLPAPFPVKAERSIESLVDHFSQAQPSAELFNATATKVRKYLDEDLGIPLSSQDREQLNYVFSAFRDEGLAISFRFGQTGGFGGGGAYRRFPDLRDLILEHDLKGNLANFLASDELYQRVRALQVANRVVPIVGDFAGKKAIAAVGTYLKRNGYNVSAFYTSNVEQFLFQNDVFKGFVENVRTLPIDDKSVLIRAVPSRQPHPAQVAGHRTTTLLQKIGVFLKDADAGMYDDYRTMVTTHFIAGGLP